MVSRLSFQLVEKFLVAIVDQGEKSASGWKFSGIKLAYISLQKCIKMKESYSMIGDKTTSQQSLLKIGYSLAKFLSLNSHLSNHVNAIELSESILMRQKCIELLSFIVILLYPSYSGEPMLDQVFLPNNFIELLQKENLSISENLQQSIMQLVTSSSKSTLSTTSSLKNTSTNVKNSKTNLIVPTLSTSTSNTESIQNPIQIEKTIQIGKSPIKRGKPSNRVYVSNSIIDSSNETVNDIDLPGSFDFGIQGKSLFENNSQTQAPLSSSNSKKSFIANHTSSRTSFTENIDTGKLLEKNNDSNLSLSIAPITLHTNSTASSSYDSSKEAKSAFEDNSPTKSLEYVPSWSRLDILSNSGLVENAWSLSDSKADRFDVDDSIEKLESIAKSKLKTLKTRKKTLTRGHRAHSAEVTSLSELGDGFEIDRTNTSDGIRNMIGNDDDIINAVKKINLDNMNDLFTNFQSKDIDEHIKNSDVSEFQMTNNEALAFGSKRTLVKRSPRSGMDNNNNSSNITSNITTSTKNTVRNAKNRIISVDASLDCYEQQSSIDSNNDINSFKAKKPYSLQISESTVSVKSTISVNSPRSDEIDKEKQSPSSPKFEGFEYVPTLDLKPFETPGKELSLVISGLENQDWPEIFHTLTSMRRISIHHQNLLQKSGNFHSLVLGVLKQADNLRSAVAKNAILCLGDLFQGMGIGMDAEVLGTISTLLKRCADSSNFLSEVSENALVQMVDNVSASRSLAGLLTSVEHRQANIRAKAAMFIDCLLLRRCEDVRGSREIEGLKLKLSKLLQDSLPETRANSRDVVRILLNNGLVQKSELEHFVSMDLIDKSLKEASSAASCFSSNAGKLRFESPVKKLNDYDVGVTPKKSLLKSSRPAPLVFPDTPSLTSASDTTNYIPSPKSTPSKKNSVTTNGAITPSRAKVAAAKRTMDSVPELQNLVQMLQDTTVSNWIDRRNALTELTNVVINYPGVLRDSGKLDGCMDRILERLEDGSVKVQIHTLECLQKINQDVPKILPALQLIVLPALLNAASFANKQVSTIAMKLFSDFIESSEPQQVIPQLCSIALHEKERLRAISLRIIGTSLNRFAESEDWETLIPTLVKKHIFSAISQTIFSPITKAEVRVAAGDALKALNYSLQISGHSDLLLKWVDNPQQQDEIRRLTVE